MAEHNADMRPGVVAEAIATHPDAGWSSFFLLPSQIPIARRDAYLHYCDTRPGPHHGCVREHDKYMADEGLTRVGVDRQHARGRSHQHHHLDALGRWEPIDEDCALHWG